VVFRYKIVLSCRNYKCLYSLNTNSSAPGRRSETIREFEPGTMIVVGCVDCKDSMKIIVPGCNYFESHGTLSVRIEAWP